MSAEPAPRRWCSGGPPSAPVPAPGTESRRARLNAMCPTTEPSWTRDEARLRDVGSESRERLHEPRLHGLGVEGALVDLADRVEVLDCSALTSQMRRVDHTRGRRAVSRRRSCPSRRSRSSRARAARCRGRCCRPLPSRRPPWSSKVVVVGAGPGAGTSTVSAGVAASRWARRRAACALAGALAGGALLGAVAAAVVGLGRERLPGRERLGGEAHVVARDRVREQADAHRGQEAGDGECGAGCEASEAHQGRG